MRFQSCHRPTDHATEVCPQVVTSQYARSERLRQIAAEFGRHDHYRETILALALRSIEIAPDYFAALLRLGLAGQCNDQQNDEPLTILGTAIRKPVEQDEVNDE